MDPTDMQLKVCVNPFTPTNHLSVILNNEWDSLLKLLSVERAD